ncbi:MULTISPECIES: hypothetical protein [Pseudomonas]|uniref:Uncharacterized protein n=2 Tax=Pseudomonas TaxID=286 RepID=A0A8T8LZ55_PSESX|nr:MULTISPECIES: hypothetical protein [Pseudomonas]MEE4667141.1 hypothetical protein [Pseudomonas alliivorans]MBF7141975.1 hypothetical protein [Pseudomonas sp. LY10J]NJP00513.1 hypothetical protein [Pseudomonas quercus]PBP61828.1 hypothetical protein CCL18_03145 [Pseudomonas syringae]QUP66627.1 hypothetical protein PSYCIT7_002865 [Pseudomonas syringae Cit 7]
MTESPYVTHRETLLEGKYGTAYLLQQFILHQYDASRYSFEIDNHRGGFDSRHFQMYQDMKQWFWEHGRTSDGFEELAETIQARWVRQAEANRDELLQLREMRPEDYPHDNGADQLESYKSAIAICEMHHQRFVEKGFLDE